jgi:dipeptidase E
VIVGGGNTRKLIALWRAAGLDLLLRDAGLRGTVLCGQSAGGVCWFECAQTTSTGRLGTVECLGFLPGSCAGHYDNVAERRPHFHPCLAEGTLLSGYGLSNDTGLEFRGTILHEAIACRPEARAYRVDKGTGGSVLETPLTTRVVTD